MPTTRFYFDRVAPGVAVTPTAWDRFATLPAGQGRLRTTPGPGSNNGSSTPNETSTTPTTSGALQLVSDPLPAPVSYAGGHATAAYFATQSLSSSNVTLRVVIRVVSGDGTTVRGVLAILQDDLYVGAGLSLVDGPLASVTAQAGDRLVVELGGHFNNTSGLARGMNILGYVDSHPDAPAVQGASGSYRPWLDIALAEPPGAPTNLTATPTPASLQVSWSAPATGPAPDGYRIRVDAGAWVDVGNVTTWLVEGFLPDSEHTVDLVAYAGTLTGPPASITARTSPPLVSDPRWWTHRLAATLGLDPETVQPVVELRRLVGSTWVVDPELSSALMSYRIVHGRKDAAGRTPPTSCTLQLVTALAGVVPIGTQLQLALCDEVRHTLDLGVDQVIRWTGEVTDPAVDHDAGVTTLTAVGRLGRLSRQLVDGAQLVAGLADDLVLQLLNASATGSGVVMFPDGSGGAVLQPPASQLAVGAGFDALVDSTGGQLVELPDGALVWHSPEHRRGTPPALSLAADAVLRRVSWSQSVGALVNVANVSWSGGQIQVADIESADPINGYGPYPLGVDTWLTTEADAYDLGVLVVGRRAAPAWQLPDLTAVPDRMLSAGRLTVAQLAALVALRHGDRINLSGLPAGCPVPAQVIVEGWEEIATPREWQLQLAVSDPALSGVSIRWIDVDDNLTWEQVHPDVDWFDTARMEYGAELVLPPD